MTARAEDNDLGVLLLERYCSGGASSDEVAQIEGWFKSHPDQRVWYEQLKAELRKESFTPMSSEERRAAWSEIIRVALQLCPETEARLMAVAQLGDRIAIQSRRISTENVPQQEAPPMHGFRRVSQKQRYGKILHRRVWSPVAGVVLGAILLVVGWKFGRAGMSGHATGSKATYTTYATAPGQRATITLPDGNTVALNVASRLEVPTNYGTGNHVVRLPVGEALFTVSHHGGIPFTVVSGTTVTRVLGTSFMVRNYSTDATVIVAVDEGKVAVGRAVVTRRRLVEVGRTGSMREGPADPEQFAFATGVLTIDSTRLSDAISELNRWYNADIRLGDAALASQLVEGKFVAGSLTDLTELLRLTFDVRVVRDGRVLTLYPRVR